MIRDEELGDRCSILLATDREWRFIAPDEWDKIDAQWSDYMSSGQRVDVLVSAEYPAGGVFIFPISDLRGMQRETREQRRAMREWHLAHDAEQKADGIIE